MKSKIQLKIKKNLLDINLFNKMQKNQQILQKVLFTFYRQQQPSLNLTQNLGCPLQSNLKHASLTKKKKKKKSKHLNSAQIVNCSKLLNNLSNEIQKDSHLKNKNMQKTKKQQKKKYLKQNQNSNKIIQRGKISQYKKNLALKDSISGKFKLATALGQNSLISKSKIEKRKLKNDNKSKNLLSLQKQASIFQANTEIGPFKKQNVFEDQESDHYACGLSINHYIKNKDNFEEIFAKNLIHNQKNPLSLSNGANIGSIGQKFLSKIIKKSKISDCDNKNMKEQNLIIKKHLQIQPLQISKTQIVVNDKNCSKLSIEKQEFQDYQSDFEYSINQESFNQPSFNQHLLSQKSNSQSKNQSAHLTPNKQKYIFKKIPNKIVTAELTKGTHLHFNYDENSASFMPTNHSLISAHEEFKKQNSQILERLNIDKHRNFRSKSRKILKFGIVKCQSSHQKHHKASQFGDINQKEDSNQSFVRDKTHSQKKKVKLPILSQGQLKNKKNMINIRKQVQKWILQQQLNSQREESKKKGLTDFIDLQKVSSKVFTQPNESKEAQKFRFPKIIENFHSRYYQLEDRQKRKNGISKLDMSENLSMNWKDQFDWQYKKMLIVKKLGIKI